MKRSKLLLAFGAGLAVMLASVVTRGALGGPSGVLIPYVGHIDDGPAPLTEPATLSFEIFDAPTDGTSCGTYTYEVTPSNGDFSESCSRGSRCPAMSR